jgi:hypothetical protein
MAILYHSKVHNGDIGVQFLISYVGRYWTVMRSLAGFFDAQLGAWSIVFNVDGKQGVSQRFWIMIELFEGEKLHEDDLSAFHAARVGTSGSPWSARNPVQLPSRLPATGMAFWCFKAPSTIWCFT